jgi:drug/metabolite transporter (DMT)-like permease
MIGVSSVLAWVMLVGFVITAPLTVLQGVPAGLGWRETVWILVSGIGNVAGLLFCYAGLRVGKVSIVAPISSTEGAIAALLAVATGETLGLGSASMLGLIVAGVVLAGITPGGGSGDPLRASLLASGAAVCFGASLFATARVSHALPIIWALIPARAVGVAVVALPLIASRRLVLTRRAVPLVIASGVCEVAGFASYALGSRHGIAVSAVLASQFAALSAIGGYFLFRERLTRLQFAGVGAIVLGVAVLSATS